MTDSLAAHLNAHPVDSARLEHAMRFLLAQWSDYTSPDDMTADLLNAGINADALLAARTALTENPSLLDEAALDLLAAAWNDPDLHDAARNSIAEASSRLPVIEIGTIVIAAMYGLWLITTRGRRSTTRTVRRGTDGAYEETETTEWYDPTGPLRTIVDLMRPTSGDELPGSASAPELPEAGQTPSSG